MTGVGRVATLCVATLSFLRKQIMRRESHHHGRARGVALCLLLTASLASGCGDPEAESRSTAVAQARGAAANAKASFTVLLQQADEAGDSDDVLSKRMQSVLGMGGSGRPLKVMIEPGRQVVAWMVFFGHGYAGGGWTYTSYSVRLCAVLRGAPGPVPTVEMEAMTCPADLPAGEPNIGTIDETVSLNG